MLPPISLPILSFGLVILLGTVLLHSRISLAQTQISWVDALFTATSATCVTGLAVVDTGTFFSRFGQSVILCLIQVGGLGIMTFTGLTFYLWRRKVALADRIAIGQSLLHDPSFHLGKFLLRIVIWTFFIEAAGALLLYLQDSRGFSPYAALFHAVSAFCNAGFGLRADSLMAWQGHWGINLVIMLLIFLGGIGFSVVVEIFSGVAEWLQAPRSASHFRVSWYGRVVLSTSCFLVVAGGAAIFLAENVGYDWRPPTVDPVLTALFQSVTCRTAGFNSVDISQMTNVSLLVMLLLMFIGGAPGSCAGGIKVTTFRALVGFVAAQMRGGDQVVIGRFAVDREAMNRAMILIVFAGGIILSATMLLNITEGGTLPQPTSRGLFLEAMFEAVSAFGTVGLSTGLTPKLTVAGKLIITALMFIGRLGPVVFLVTLQRFHEEKFYSWPEENMLVG